MESVLDYIIANYVWFLVGFVIITMMIIGYVADTTDFWHKKKPKKDKSNSEYVEDNDESSKIQEALDKLKDKKISDAISPDINEVNNDLNATLVSEVTDVKPVVSDDLNVPFGDPIINNNDSNVNSISEDLNAPFGDTAIKNNNSFDDSNEIINKVKDITPNQE